MRGSETVLLIDDEEPVLDIGTRFLTNFGYRVITALNGEIAWDLFLKFRDEIDLIITDVLMPDMSGFDLAQKVHAHAPDIPVLYVSGQPEPLIRRAGLNPSRVTLLCKPYTVMELLAAARSTLDRQQLL